METYKLLPGLNWPIRTKPSTPNADKALIEARNIYLAGKIYKEIEIKNDWMNNSIIGFGAFIYAIDRTPFPIGESVLVGSFYLASKRSQKIGKPEYDRSVLETALENLNSKEKSTPLLPASDIARCGPQPRV